MRRFYIDKGRIEAGIVTINGREAHHIRDVIRLRPGDRFIGFDGQGKNYMLRVKSIGSDIKAGIERTSLQRVDSPDILLACALPKKSKIDYIIEKATELGVKDIIPMITKHTVVKVDKQSGIKKKKRWEKIALEASKQCGRDTLPKIHAIAGFKQALELSERLGYKNRLIPYVCESATHIKDALPKKTSTIAIFIGPEGDFSREEIELAKTYNFKTVSLGNLVLRVDTAAIFAISAVCNIFN